MCHMLMSTGHQPPSPRSAQDMSFRARPIYSPRQSPDIAIMRARLALAAAMLVILSCNSASGPRVPGPFHIFHALAVATHDSLQSTCEIEGSLDVPFNSVPPWQGEATVSVGRWVATTHGVIAAHTRDITVSFSVTQDSNALVLTRGAPLDTTRTVSVVHSHLDPIDGTWTCPATLPFADDSLLISHGYQTTPAPSGSGAVRWVGGAWTSETLALA